MTSMRSVNQWVQYWQPGPLAQVRLFCFPYAGGGASMFRSWQGKISPMVEIVPVQLPGRESRLLEAPIFHLPALIEPLAQALLPYMNMPYAFFGHSMGALISFELARYLRCIEHYSAPVHLFVSGHRAPHLPDLDPPINHLPEPEFIEALRRLQGTPEGVFQNAELLRLLLPMLRADFTLCEMYSYRPEKLFTFPITAFGGLQDAEVSREEIMGWRTHTSGSFRTRLFAGDHFFLHKEQIDLLQDIAQDLLNDR